MSVPGSVRVRFAPSPTGHLHIGGMRSAIFNWLFARHNNGSFLLRIEDTDRERSKQEYTDSILASFAWMRIDWDEPVVIQSERAKRHQEVAQKLYAQGKAYYCICTPEQVQDRLAAQSGFDINFMKYDGLCRNASHTKGALRFKIPDDITEVTFHDLIRDTITIGIDQLDDFILVRSDGTPMYNFVVVVDDADMKISHVIRGEEHIANTPKQILLYQACGFPLPYFAHLPMILGPDGNKLSKRDAATGVFEYKQLGYIPDALFNYLVRLGWSHGDQEIFTREEVIQFFDLAHVGKKGAIFDQQKLDWINGVYMRGMSDQALLAEIEKDLWPTMLSDLPVWHSQTVLVILNIYKQRAKTVRELIIDIKALYQTPHEYNAHDLQKWWGATTGDDLRNVQEFIQTITPFTADHITAAIKEWTKQQNLKIVAIAQPLRIALIGKSDGPSVFELMAALGKDTAVHRIQKLLTYKHAGV